MTKRTGITALTGILRPSSWDERGAVTGLTLATDTEEEYLIRCSRIGALLRFLGEEVAVRGRLRRDGRDCSLDVLDVHGVEDNAPGLPGRNMAHPLEEVS